MRQIIEGKLQVVDAALPKFDKSTSEQLGFIFQNFKKGMSTIIPIPLSYLRGTGKGFMVDVMEHTGCKETYSIPMYRWGVPIDENIVFLSNYDMGKRKGKVRSIRKSEGFIRHNSKYPMRKVKVGVDLVSQEFVLSAGKMFHPRNEWRERTPIVQDSKDYLARLLNGKECMNLFGEANPENHVPMRMIIELAKVVA